MIRAEEAWAVYEYREHPRGLYFTCYVDGYKQAEKDIIANLRMMLSVTEEGWLNENLNIFIKKWEEQK